MLGFNGPDDGLEEWDNELDKPLWNGASAYVTFDEDEDSTPKNLGCVWNIKVAWVAIRNPNRCCGATSISAG